MYRRLHMTKAQCSCRGSALSFYDGKCSVAVAEEANRPASIAIAQNVVHSGQDVFYSRAFTIAPHNSALVIVIMVSHDGFGEVSCEFQGAGSLEGSFVTVEPSAVVVSAPGETKSIVLQRTGFPFVRARFFSAGVNRCVFSANLRGVKL